VRNKTCDLLGSAHKCAKSAAKLTAPLSRSRSFGDRALKAVCHLVLRVTGTTMCKDGKQLTTAVYRISIQSTHPICIEGGSPNFKAKKKFGRTTLRLRRLQILTNASDAAQSAPTGLPCASVTALGLSISFLHPLSLCLLILSPRCVASAASGQNVSAKMRDFELLCVS
jgi:hypothetical protein